MPSFPNLLAVLLALCLGMGCATVAPEQDTDGTPASLSFPEDYERQVAPFEVRDAEGVPYDHPFTGGFNNPRPQFVDINDDGYPDLFVQEQSNELMFFENVPDGNGGRTLVWRTDRYRDLDVGEWFRFVDPQGDGMFDLITEAPFNYIRYHRNTGTAADPTFTLAADTLHDATGEPIFSDRQNIPNIANIDCDEFPDLFLGRLDGTITRFKAEGFDAEGVPQFARATDRFEGIEIVNEMGSMPHGANSLAFADYDGNGQIDLFWGDFFEPSLLLIENQGRCGAPDFRTQPQVFPPNDPVQSSGYNVPALVDWTGNGLKDLFVGILGGAHDPNSTLDANFFYYEATGPDAYELQTETFLRTINIGSETTAAAGDLTGNGAMDLLLANRIDPDNRQTSTVHFFANEGTAEAPDFQKRGMLDLPAVYDYAPALGDLTGNGRLDLVLGTWRGELLIYTHDGMDADGIPQFVQDDTHELETPRGSTAIPTLVDLNGDGLLDIVTGVSNGRVYLFQNEGTAEAPAFVLQEDAFATVKVDRRSAPAFHDVEGNGTLDLIVGSEGGGLVLHRNLGTAEAPVWGAAEPLALDVPPYATPLFVDLFGTGTPALLLGGRSGGLVYFGPAASPVARN